MFAVSDNGCGMSADVKMNLFEPFFTTKEMGKGTGLGLATVYGIVNQNKGFIQVYSEPGAGTAFQIYLPAVWEVPEATCGVNTSADCHGNECVLIVEDDPVIRELAKTILKKYGYTVLDAGHPAEAIEISKQYDYPIDLLITDVVMPGMNGKELKDRIEQDRPGIRVLYMSGYTENAIAHHGVIDSDIDFLQKPFSVTALAGKVRGSLRVTL